MSTTFMFVVLLTSTSVFLLLPFLPGFIELWRKEDAEPLRVVRDYDVDVRHFARGFGAYIRSNFESDMQKCQRSGVPLEGVLKDGLSYLMIRDENDLILNQTELETHEVQRILLSCSSLRLPGDLIFTREVFAAVSVHGGERNIYRAVLTDGNIDLGTESTLLRWMHAAGNVRVKRDCLLHGRVSADTLIRLEAGCRFERLHAPRIDFGNPVSRGKATKKRLPLEPSDIPMLVNVTGRRWLIDRKTTIPPGRVIDADMVFTDEVWIGAGTEIRGSIKSHKDIHLDEDVRIRGSVVSVHDIHIGPGCEIHGPVLAERSVTIAKGTSIGHPDSLTTMSARDIYIATGVVAHGTVWTRREGVVYEDGAT